MNALRHHRIVHLPACVFALLLIMAGPVPIESIEPEDMVLARDEFTGEQGLKPVLYTITTHPDTLYLVSFEPGDGAEETLVTTGEHPFYVAGREAFVPAAELAVGDVLALARSPGFTAHVTDIRVQLWSPGLATNAITAAMKVIAKRIPPSAVKAVFKTADSFRASAQLLVEYLQKFP